MRERPRTLVLKTAFLSLSHVCVTQPGDLWILGQHRVWPSFLKGVLICPLLWPST